MADELLAHLEGTGVMGLGLAVGPLRRPFAAESPLLDPADWEGARFRVFNSPVQADAVRALGGTPANLYADWINEIKAGTLRGAELDIAGYAPDSCRSGTSVGTAVGSIPDETGPARRHLPSRHHSGRCRGRGYLE